VRLLWLSTLIWLLPLQRTGRRVVGMEPELADGIAFRLVSEVQLSPAVIIRS
jgi:hypothetical protein